MKQSRRASEKKATELVNQMTLEEKARSQLVVDAPGDQATGHPGLQLVERSSPRSRTRRPGNCFPTGNRPWSYF